MTDWGLHRQWVVERDAAHPERPGRLVEAAWCDAARDGSEKAVPVAHGPGEALVRPGMRVMLWQRNARGKMQLNGTALAAGRLGERVRVRVAWRGTVLNGVVRGPGQVEIAAAGER